MLTLTGKYLGTNRERVAPRPGGKQFEPFDRVTVDVLVQGANGARVEACETVKDFPLDGLPAEGSEVSVVVVVNPYNTGGGGGYRLRALSLASGGRRLAPAPASSAS